MLLTFTDFYYLKRHLHFALFLKCNPVVLRLDKRSSLRQATGGHFGILLRMSFYGKSGNVRKCIYW